MRYIRKSALYLFIVGVLCSTVSGAADEKITICVHPYSSATKLYEAFTPLAQYLAGKIEQPVDIHISTDYQSHIDSMGKGKYGIGYLGPASYIKMVEMYGKKRLLARQAINGEPVFRGKIIVRKDSSINTLADLVGKRFAFGDPNSTMSHLVPRYMLLKAGVKDTDLAEIKFLGNHTNVALGVLAGEFDAGAVKEATFYKYENRGLRTLATTPALSEHLFVASDQLSDELVEKIRQALLEAHQTKQGLDALNAIKSGISALVPAQDSDYDNLREILSTLKQQGII